MSGCPPVRRSFSDECGPGTFHPLGDLPRRNPGISARKAPVFHLAHDDDDDHASSVDEHSPQPLSILPPTVPFPRSTSLPSSSKSPTSSPPPSPLPQLARGASAPIYLSNGKPLKPSLKSSSSSPAMLTCTQAQHIHLRSRSEPSTPKNVHFPEKDHALATVRIFNRSARPAALSNSANSNGDETETEGDETPPTHSPFPGPPPILNHQIDSIKSSAIPSEFPSSAYLLLESLNLSPFSLSPGLAAKPFLTGSVLVRNLAFEKHVAIRFTLDNWQTVSEVGAHYAGSLTILPSQISPLPPVSTSEDASLHRGRGWDRFTFTIRLEDYVHSLSTRTLWLAARYHITSTYPEPGSARYGPGGEWWDNNGGKNYRVEFIPVVGAPISSQGRFRRETISAPILPPRTQPQPATTCKEHASGLMIPSFPNKEIQPVKETNRRSMSLCAGKLGLCNYAPPTVHATSSVLSPSASTPQRLLSSSTTGSELPPLSTLQSPSDEDTVSPASSTLPTPSISPVMAPHVIINGQLATSAHPNYTCEEDASSSSRPGHISDWDWPAPSKPLIGGPPRHHSDLVPVSELSERQRDTPSPTGRKVLADSSSLYNAFVTQWCFAHEPSPTHHEYDYGGIMA